MADLRDRILGYGALLALLLLAAHAAAIRLEYAVWVREADDGGESPFLQGDAQRYHDLAISTPFPCFSTERPPAFLALGRAALFLWGDLEAGTEKDLGQAAVPARGRAAGERRARVLANHRVLRRVGIAASLLAMGALVALAWLLAGRFAAVVVAGLWAYNPWDIYYSTSFLREDVLILCQLLVAVLFLAWLRLERGSRRIALIVPLLVAVGAAAAHIHLAALLPLVALVIAFNAAKTVFRRWERRDLVWSAALLGGVALLCLPYLLYNRAHAGSMFAPMDKAALGWRNHEFAGRPGFPTRAEVAQDCFAGPEISTARYVFGLHTPLEVLARYVHGYWCAFVHYLPRLLGPWRLLAWLVLPGFVACHFLRAEGYLTACATLVSILPNAFILPLDTVLTPEVPEVGPGVEPRFVMPLLPFAILLCAVALEQGRRLVLHHRGRGDQPVPAPTCGPG